VLAKVCSAAVNGIEAYPVEVEVNVGFGDTIIVIVGLPDAAVKESRDRVLTALLNSGFNFTFGRTTINLAPADVKKEGPSFDLPIAIGMIAASEQLDTDQLDNFVIVGELALTGAVAPVVRSSCKPRNKMTYSGAWPRGSSTVGSRFVYPFFNVLEIQVILTLFPFWGPVRTSANTSVTVPISGARTTSTLRTARVVPGSSNPSLSKGSFALRGISLPAHRYTGFLSLYLCPVIKSVIVAGSLLMSVVQPHGVIAKAIRAMRRVLTKGSVLEL
jgi:hypothetical protein